MFTLITNTITWSLGVNYVTQHAAEFGTLPKFLASKSKKNGMPLGANLTNGVVISALLVSAALLDAFGSGTDVFWMFFALNVDLLLACYLFLFPSFLKLRKSDAQRPRPYRVKGGKAKLILITVAPFAFLCITLFFTFFTDTPGGALSPNLPLILGVAGAVAVGELVAAHSVRKHMRDKSSLAEPSADR